MAVWDRWADELFSWRASVLKCSTNSADQVAIQGARYPHEGRGKSPMISGMGRLLGWVTTGCGATAKTDYQHDDDDS